MHSSKVILCELPSGKLIHDQSHQTRILQPTAPKQTYYMNCSRVRKPILFRVNVLWDVSLYGLSQGQRQLPKSLKVLRIHALDKTMEASRHKYWKYLGSMEVGSWKPECHSDLKFSECGLQGLQLFWHSVSQGLWPIFKQIFFLLWEIYILLLLFQNQNTCFFRILEFSLEQDPWLLFYDNQRQKLKIVSMTSHFPSEWNVQLLEWSKANIIWISASEV